MTQIDATLAFDDSRAKRNVWVLVAAQAILGAQMPMIFVVGGLAGQTLVGGSWLAGVFHGLFGWSASGAALVTFPISLIVFGSMTTAPWLSPLMQRRGRRFGFFVGALSGALGALICAIALWYRWFELFLLGSYFTGIYMSAHGFYRFAATDTASDAYRPKAISYVMAGGLLSALIGPQLVKVTGEAMIIPFMGTYLAAAALNLGGMFLFFGLDIPKPAPKAANAPAGRSRMELLAEPKILVAIICGMVSYALMNLVMTSTPLAVVGCGFSTGNAADVVSAHVIAMYAPSFFTGHLIARFGAIRIVSAGLICLAAAGAVALHDVALGNFYLALVLLGVGWNFGFIGATAMLTTAHAPHERGTVQGMNDALVFGLVTLASFSSGGLVSSGDEMVAGWNAVNIAMVPFLTLAGAALIWLRLRPAAS